MGVPYPIISSALLPVTGRAACIGRARCSSMVSVCHWSLFMVDRLFRWIVDFLLCGRVLKELYKFFTVYACIYLPRCSMYKKTGREEKKIGKLFFLFSFFFQKKKNNSYLISYVTDSFEFFKRYEKFLGWNLGWNWKNGWKKKKKKRERDKVFLLLSPLYEFRQNCWSDIGNLAVVIECCAVEILSLTGWVTFAARINAITFRGYICIWNSPNACINRRSCK